MLPSNRAVGARTIVIPTQAIAHALSAVSALPIRDHHSGAAASGHVWSTAASAKDG
jgi:hypothetical protein